jgi:hypothetical protein
MLCNVYLMYYFNILIYSMPIAISSVSLAAEKLKVQSAITSYTNKSVQNTYFSVYHVLLDFIFMNLLHRNRKDVRCEIGKKKLSAGL